MKITAYYIAKFRELFKNEIEKFFSAPESGFLRSTRALGRNFWINYLLFLFQRRLSSPSVSKLLVMPPHLIGDIIRSRSGPYSMIFARFSIFRAYV